MTTLDTIKRQNDELIQRLEDIQLQLSERTVMMEEIVKMLGELNKL